MVAELEPLRLCRRPVALRLTVAHLSLVVSVARPLPALARVLVALVTTFVALPRVPPHGRRVEFSGVRFRQGMRAGVIEGVEGADSGRCSWHRAGFKRISVSQA